MGSMLPQFHEKPIVVPGRTLDKLISENRISDIAILKVDVEGNEAAVFRGARKLLTSARPPVVVFEFCDWAEERSPEGIGAAQRVLREMGYSMNKLRGLDLPDTDLPEIMTSGFEMLVAWKPTHL